MSPRLIHYPYIPPPFHSWVVFPIFFISPKPSNKTNKPRLLHILHSTSCVLLFVISTSRFFFPEMKIKFPQTSPTISLIGRYLYLLDFSLNTRYLFVYSQDLLLNIRYDLALESWKGGKSLVYLPLPDCTYSTFRYLFNARVIFTPLITSVCFLKRHR